MCSLNYYYYNTAIGNEQNINLCKTSEYGQEKVTITSTALQGRDRVLNAWKNFKSFYDS